MSIRYLPDRFPKEELSGNYPDVAACLRKRWHVMMENSRELVAWVGVARATTQETVLFVPHGAPTGETEREDFAKNLMQAIVRFAREHSRDGDERSVEGATLAALLAELATDYRDHGLYSVRERLRSRQDGKPDWARTVKSEIAFPAGDGSPIYCNISTLRSSPFATNIVARIQAEVIAEIGRCHGWWLVHYFGNRDIPRPGQAMAQPREVWPRLLRLARRDLYQSRAINLVGLLLEYLEATEETGVGSIVCGIPDFSTMWEAMLRETLEGVESHWNARLPGPRYFRPGDSQGDETGRMQTDIVVRRGQHIGILDAKYYRATSKGFVPGVADVTKQIIYQQAAESAGLVDPRKIANAFLFPAEATCRTPYEKVALVLPDGTPAAGFPQVQCQYVSVSDVVEAYAGRKKLSHQQWLSDLCLAS